MSIIDIFCQLLDQLVVPLNCNFAVKSNKVWYCQELRETMYFVMLGTILDQGFKRMLKISTRIQI